MARWISGDEASKMLSAMVVDSPVGHLTITATAEAVVSIGWGGEPTDAAEPLLIDARRQLEAYFAGRLTRFDLPLKPAGSPFDQRVWEAMRRIPYGQTRTYGELAMAVGSAPRAIGGACGRNPIPIVIPCHRILARGRLGGYSGGTGLPTKTWLLELEGASCGGLFSATDNARQRAAATAASVA
jgi:methylated-DNA-[protein]-cysteine S-methyltransferase